MDLLQFFRRGPCQRLRPCATSWWEEFECAEKESAAAVSLVLTCCCSSGICFEASILVAVEHCWFWAFVLPLFVMTSPPSALVRQKGFQKLRAGYSRAWFLVHSFQLSLPSGGNQQNHRSKPCSRRREKLQLAASCLLTFFSPGTACRGDASLEAGSFIVQSTSLG